MTSNTKPSIIKWLLDTRDLWQAQPGSTGARDEVEGLKTTAARALSMLPQSEQFSVLKYYHLKDAKMSLGSHLLKHLIVTKYCGVPWSKSIISRDENGKPCYKPEPGTDQSRIDFNVSHQAGIVSLIAAIGFEEHNWVEVGTDVVCWNERLKHDYSHIEKEGFFSWIDIYADVFAESEINHMKLGPIQLDSLAGCTTKGYGHDTISRCQWRGREVSIDIHGRENEKTTTVKIESDTIIEAKLRRFYAMWCLREAYVKMTGEALLAPWLKELEISHVQAPIPKSSTDGLKSHPLEEGETVKYSEIYLKERKILNVAMELTALGAEYMVAGSVRQADMSTAIALGTWKQLDLETCVLNYAESAL